ncbi:hypothetical protein LZC95_39835 [Pendulispora brunnea]|uniref:Uncharacterized protein n=1 Tax=Pendulispora brunnea TaxID=2905690 RepID=A0ABZ2K899_9BACT
MRIRFHDEDFDGFLRCRAWQNPGQHLSVDATVELEARSLMASERRILGLLHGHLSRKTPQDPFAIPLGPGELRTLLEYADSECPEREPETEYLRVPDLQWLIKPCPIQETVALQYAGAARQFLESRLALDSYPDMQDWPLEVSNPDRIEEFCNFYDENTDPVVRFDTMQLALYSLEHCADKNRWASWFYTRLRRDFALHGHTIAYWACLQRDAADPEFRRRDPEFVFPISGLLRTVWEESLVAVDSIYI